MTPVCGVCGGRLRLRSFLRNLWRRPGKVTYPFRMAEGARQETRVRWICGACERRGQRHREEAARGDTLGRP
jgi:hypothetical protein